MYSEQQKIDERVCPSFAFKSSPMRLFSHSKNTPFCEQKRSQRALNHLDVAYSADVHRLYTNIPIAV